MFLCRNYLDDLEGCSYGELVPGSFITQSALTCIMSCAECFGKTPNHPGDSSPLQARMASYNFWLFPKLKLLSKRRDFRPSMRFRKIHWGQLMMTGRTVRSQGAYFEGDWGIIVLCTMFLVSCVFFNRCLYFSYHMLDTFWTDLVYISDWCCFSGEHWLIQTSWL